MTRRPQTTEALVAVLLRRLADWGHGESETGHVWMRGGWAVMVAIDGAAKVSTYISNDAGLRVRLRGPVNVDSLPVILDAVGAPDGAL